MILVSALALSAQHLNGTIFWQVLIQSPEVTRKKLSDPFVVSDLKEKASQVKSAGVKSYGTPEKDSPPKPLVRPLANQSHHRRLLQEGHQHHSL